MTAYLEALHQEILCCGRSREDGLVTSVFVGGGTPSLLSGDEMERLFVLLRQQFAFAEDAEITMEANPGTLTEANLEGYRRAGINRLSIGCQSVHDEELEKLGRIHRFADFCESFSLARKAGFTNINVDLMSALPGQDLCSWEDCLEQIMAFAPEHISAYSLIIEEGTPFAKNPQILSELPPEMVDRRMYEITKQLLAAHGYDRYEFSNYAKPGYECKHNMVYWTGGEYIGLGIGASSYFQGKRFNNMRDIFKYIELMENLSDKFVETDNMELLYNDTTRMLRENVTNIYIDSRMEEFMFLGLRMTCGVSREDFKERFNKDIYEVYGSVLNKYISEGFMAVEGDRIYLTDAGIDVSNVILADFLLDS